MQSQRNIPRKGAKFMDTKVLIATLSVAVTVGVWNVLSNNAYAAEKVAPRPVISVPPQPQTGTAQGFPPLPTVMPLIQIAVPQPQAAAPAQAANKNQDQPVSASQTTQLRAVAAPTQVIVQKAKPVFVQPVQVVNVVGGGGGGGGGGSAAAASPVTSTGSSK